MRVTAEKNGRASHFLPEDLTFKVVLHVSEWWDQDGINKGRQEMKKIFHQYFELVHLSTLHHNEETWIINW